MGVLDVRKVAVIGVGNSKFGVRNDVTISELAFEAVKPSLQDAGLAAKDIEYVALGSVGAGAWYEELLPAVVVSEYCGMTGAGLVRCEAACASGSAAFFTAYSAIASGQADVAMALGAEKMREIDNATSMEWIGRAGYYLWEFHNFGITFPAYYALYATAHMARFGTTEEDLALVAVKNHKYAVMNPIAHLHNKVTVDDVLSSMVIASPLKLYDCCPLTDGSSSIILASEEKVKELKLKPLVRVVANAVVGSDPEIMLTGPIYVTPKVLTKAGLSMDDIEIFEINEAFAPIPLAWAKELKADRSKLNVNGGALALGHPVGNSGCRLTVTAINELMRRKARYALVSLCTGGGMAPATIIERV